MLDSGGPENYITFGNLCLGEKDLTSFSYLASSHVEEQMTCTHRTALNIRGRLVENNDDHVRLLSLSCFADLACNELLCESLHLVAQRARGIY